MRNGNNDDGKTIGEPTIRAALNKKKKVSCSKSEASKSAGGWPKIGRERNETKKLHSK